MAKYDGDHADYLAMLDRMIRAAGRRVAESDPEDLRQLRMLRDELDQAIDQAARAQHASGFSWTQIAAPLGISRQAALKAWGTNA